MGIRGAERACVRDNAFPLRLYRQANGNVRRAEPLQWLGSSDGGFSIVLRVSNTWQRRQELALLLAEQHKTGGLGRPRLCLRRGNKALNCVCLSCIN